MMRTLGLVGALILGLVAAVLAARTPTPPASPAAAQFHAAAAMADIGAIAQRAHPIGSADHARVRDYLVGRLHALGLEVRTQTGQAVEARSFGDRTGISGGQVENLIGVLPGKDRALPALAIQAHYDSVSNSPGAADDSTGVGVALDVARALRARGQPERDVVILLTDGEESGLLGARAFYASDPLAKHLGLVINMEARGGGGRVSMFETSDHNGGLIDAFRKVTPDTTSTSLAIFIYQHMPNDTDLTVTKKAGIAGLNYAFVDRLFDYHAASSTPANLDRGSVQHMGQQVLAAAGTFAFARDLPRARPDVVYSDLLGHMIVAYPQWAGWLVLLAGAGLALAALARARRSEPLSLVAAVKAAGGLVLATVLAGALSFGARILTGLPADFTGERPLLAQFGRFETATFVIGLGCLLLVYAWLAGRKGRPWSAWAGALTLGLVIAATAQILAPPTAFLFAWPLLIAGLVAAVIAFAGKADFDRPVSIAAMVVLGGLILGQLFYMARFIDLCVGADLPSALAVFVLLVGLVVTPYAWGGGGRAALAGVLLLVIGLGLVLMIRFTDPSSPRHPRATDVLYLADTDTGAALRVSGRADTDAWTRAVLGADGGPIVHADVRGFGEGQLTARATPIKAAAPQVTATAGPDGRTVLHLAQAADSRSLRLAIWSDKPISAVTIKGERLKTAARKLYLTWSAPGRTVDAVIDAPAGARLDIRALEFREGWPRDAKPLPPRPGDAMAWGDSDMTVSTAAVRR